MKYPRLTLTIGGLLALTACSPPNPAPDATIADAGAVDTPDVPASDTVEPDAGPPPREPLTWAVTQPGPYRVGYRTWRTTYTPPGRSASRTIGMNVWYPTLATTGRNPRYFAIVLDRGSFIDAPAAEPVHPRGYPVHVYSHGHMGFGGTSHSLMRYFASHGWVVVAPDHTGNTLSDTPDPLPVDINYLRSMDVTASLNALEALPAGDPLASHCDTGRVVLSGHSFGTHTVWASAGATFDLAAIRTGECMAAGRCTEADLAVFTNGLRDPRIVAAIPMAGAIRRQWFGTAGHGSVQIPLLAMSGTADPVGADTQFETTTGVDLTWIDVTGGCHQFFGLGGCSEIEDSLQATIVGAYSLALARKHVLWDEDPTVRGVLDGSVRLSDRVSFHRR